MPEGPQPQPLQPTAPARTPPFGRSTAAPHKFSPMRPAMSNSRPMFWRIVRRLLSANRGRLFVILLALGAGAAVTAALLNLQVDAKRRLTTEFRALGANIIVAPRDLSQATNPTLDQSIVSQVPSTLD